ncbi:hypothetical protein WN51_12137 [Melipona quadrifasciata]|uniref:Uncharacterized protein n=1 Tax=Melipona quadrifasciata TaxID=166423 RepID=A0A0M9A4S5_9HYME|nr:hypothetical protein WN51_12137 [Melipona quadrifasciata]
MFTTLVSRFPSEGAYKCHQSNHLAIDFPARPGNDFDVVLKEFGLWLRLDKIFANGLFDFE